ncbi:MAG: hydrogenase maturation nickel metallochaperone HypA [Kineosporiaceae bacterium]|jgi:hydrogenase nickel incorporation protein HypA/HybF
MHELSVCTAIADAVRTHAGDRPVYEVRLCIGHLRQLVPDSLTFCWSLVADHGGLAGARLVIDEVPAEIECEACGRRTVLDHPVLLCPDCSSRLVRIIAGEECHITSIVLGDGPGTEER